MEEFLKAIESQPERSVCVDSLEGFDSSSNSSQNQGDEDSGDGAKETIFIQIDAIDGGQEIFVKEEPNSSSQNEEEADLHRASRPSSKRPSADSTTSVPEKRQRTSHPSAGVDAVLSAVKECLENSRKEDEFDIVGKIVTSKLRRMPANMRLRAEKLIDITLTRGLNCTLSPSTKLISP